MRPQTGLGRKENHFMDGELTKYRPMVNAYEAESISLQALAPSATILQAARNMRINMQADFASLIAFRKSLEDLRASGQVSSDFEIGRRFPRWIDETDDLIRRFKLAIDRVDRVLAANGGSSLKSTKGSKGLFGNNSVVSDVVTGGVLLGAVFAIYKCCKK